VVYHIRNIHDQQHLRFVLKIRNEELIIAFGQRVRYLRQKKGLTMEALAASANIEYRQLSDVELGKTNATLSTALAIAQALGVPFRELMDLDGF